jgi:glutathione S-transferase
MSLVFYCAPMSTATITELVLAELAVPHEKVLVDLAKKDQRKPEFLALNPNGKVPVIVHDGTPIFESAAITMYLGEMFGVAKNLYPEPGPRRGSAMKWITWCNVTLGDAVYRWARNTTEWLPAEQRNAAAGAAGRADMMECLGILDRALAERQFLCDTYTVADTHLNSFIDWLRHMKVDLSGLPQLTAWSQRCRERPAYQRTMGGHGA